MHIPNFKGIFVLFCVVALIAFPTAALGKASATITPPATTVQEGADFATLVLHDPWDMSQFSDVSQLLNNSGQTDQVRKISVANGLFTGTASPAAQGSFWVLTPGINKTIAAGKLGSIYPISTSTYHCLYIAMQVNTNASDFFQVYWFAGKNLATGVFGSTKGIRQYPEAGSTPSMRIYKVDLAATPKFGTAWSSIPSVQGLRINPTIKPGVTFSVDWVRLTNCNSVSAPLTWTDGTSTDTAIWLQPIGVGTTRNIRAATGVNGASGSYDLDTQGIAPGSYYVGLGTDTTCCSQMNTSSPLIINQTPTMSFSRPSFSSGPGVVWDFNSSTDVKLLYHFKSTSFTNGALNMVTASGPRPGGVDAQIYLTTPSKPQIMPNTVRYLSFRMYSNNARAPWGNIFHGMLARFIWQVKGPHNGACYLVGQPIPYDIGYNTYSIDLYDAFNGKAVQKFGDCTGLSPTWINSAAIVQLRFDPNENVTCATNRIYIVKTCGAYTQKLDWMRLTAPDQVAQGTAYPVQFTLNRDPQSLSLSFYYTTDKTNPTQTAAVGSQTNSSYDVTYQWDTTGVPAGTYYICAHAEDGYNPVTYCSEATVTVTTP